MLSENNYYNIEKKFIQTKICKHLKRIMNFNKKIFLNIIIVQMTDINLE